MLTTGHRREDFGDSFWAICEAIRQLAAAHSEVHFVDPVHLNPNILQIDPLECQHFVCLLKHFYLVLTDSGRIHEEAPNLGKPVLVMREVTERPDRLMRVKLGWRVRTRQNCPRGFWVKYESR